MKKNKLVLSIVLTVIFLLCSISVSAASASSYLSCSSTSIKQGDTLTVTITVSSNEALYNVQGYLDYNSSVLKYTGGGVSASGGKVMLMHGSMELDAQPFKSDSVTVSFTAIGSGNSPLSYYATDSSTENFEVASISGCSATVKVTKPVTESKPESSDSTYEPEDESEEPNEEEKPKEEEPKEEELFVIINNVEYKIWQDYEGVELPDGFGPFIFEYQNHQSQGAVDGSGTIRLAYLENTNTKEKGFYIYYNEIFSPYIPINAVDASYVLYPLAEDVKVPAIFDKRVDNYRGGKLPVWQSSDERLEGITLMYATSPGGERGLYLYDERTATVQRFIQINYEDPVIEEIPVEPVEPIDKAQSLYAAIIEDERIFIIIAVLFALSVSLFIACIFSFSLRRSKKFNKEKFEKKMNKKKERFEKRNKKHRSDFSSTAEFTIETENFDEMEEEKIEVE